MADSGNQKVSHAGEPATQFNAIAAVVPPVQVGYAPTYTASASPGTFDGASLLSDTVDLPAYQLYRGIFVSVAGTIKMNDWDGNTVVITAPQGVLPFRPRRIWATGTAATGIVGLR